MEEEFAFLLTDARATTYNLLELRHGVDILVNHNQFHHLAIDSSRKQFARGGNNRIFRRNRDEVVEFALAVLVRTCDANHIVRVLLAHVRILVHKGSPHPFCMFFVGTEDDGLVHPSCLLQVLRNFMSNFPDSVLNDDIVVVI